MKKIIILDYVHGNVSVLNITDKLLDSYEDNVETILKNEYEFYHSEIEWMELDIDEFGNFEVYQDTLYERKS